MTNGRNVPRLVINVKQTQHYPAEAQEKLTLGPRKLGGANLTSLFPLYFLPCGAIQSFADAKSEQYRRNEFRPDLLELWHDKEILHMRWDVEYSTKDQV